MSEAEANALLKEAEKACVTVFPLRALVPWPAAKLRFFMSPVGIGTSSEMDWPFCKGRADTSLLCREHKKNMFLQKKPDWEKAADCYQKAASIFRSPAVCFCESVCWSTP